MLRWLGARLGVGRRVVPNRATRRALTRLARPPRGEVRRIAGLLRPLSAEDRERVLERLPVWQADHLRDALKTGR